MQSQHLTAVFVVVGKYQLVIVNIDGVHKSIDDFLSIIRVIDVAVLVFADPFHNLLLRKTAPLQLQLRNAFFQRFSLSLQILQTLLGRICDDAKPNSFHHIPNLSFTLLKLLFQHRRDGVLLLLHDNNSVCNPLNGSVGQHLGNSQLYDYILNPVLFDGFSFAAQLPLCAAALVVMMPKLESYTDVTIKRFPALTAYMKSLCERTEAIRSKAVDRRVDNMLKVSTDG